MKYVLDTKAKMLWRNMKLITHNFNQFFPEEVNQIMALYAKGCVKSYIAYF